MKAKTPLHEKIIDSERISSITDKKSKKRIDRYNSLILLITGCLPIAPTFYGYNYVTLDGIIIEVFFDILVLAYLYCFVRMAILVHKYRFFRKTIYFHLLYLPFFLMALVMCLLPLFTGKLIVTNHSVTFSNNVAYFFVVFLPIFFAYIVFMAFAVFKGLARGLKPMEDKMQEGQDHPLK